MAERGMRCAAGSRIFLFVLLFSFVILCRGQGCLVHQYSESDGLASANVYDIAQDRLGRMWFATRAGISCYDGVSWKNFTMTDGLPAQTFKKITIDHEGRIWALSGLAQGGIHAGFFDGRAWHFIDKLATGPQKTGEITSFFLSGRADEITLLVGTRFAGLFQWQGGKWQQLTTRNGLPGNAVNGIALLKGEWLLATDNGLAVLQSGGTISNRLNQSLNVPAKEVESIVIEESAKYPDSRLTHCRVWLCGRGWLGYFPVSENSVKLVRLPVKIAFNKIEPETSVKMTPDYRGGLYIGDRREVYYFNLETATLKPINVRSGLISAGSNSLFIDFEKNVWIACDRGISKIASRRFSNFQMVHGLLEDEVTAVAEYQPGKFIFGHNKGLTTWDGGRFRQIPFTAKDGTVLPSCRVLDIKVDSRGSTWVTASQAGLVKIDPHNEMRWYGKAQGLSAGSIVSLWIDQADNLWVGTDRGLYLRKENGFVRVPESPDTLMRRIYGTKENTLYLTTPAEGLYVHEKGRWKNFSTVEKNSINSTFAVHQDIQGRLLIGTMAGLYTLAEGGLEKFTGRGFGIDRPVYFIAADTNQRLWFGTNNGVVCWDGKKETAYSTADGLVGQETNRAAGMIDSSGRMWIGTNRGVSVYNEQFDNHKHWHPAPRLRLLYLEADERKFPMDQPIKLSRKAQPLTFHFRGISFLDEKALRFSHKLEGLDREWVAEHYPFNQMIRYSSLPPGRYRLHLKVKNALGRWSEPVTSPELVVLKPFYQQWWFYLLAAVLALFIFYAVSRFITQQRYASLLEKQVKERTEQLQAMQQQLAQSQKMEAIGTLAGGIAHDFNNILSMIVGYTELAISDYPDAADMRRSMENVLTAAERAAGVIKQILTFSRRSEHRRSPLKLSIIVKEALKLLRASLPATIEIRQEIRSQSDLIMSDLTQLHQIMMNLAANAAHAMQEEGGVLTVTLEELFLDEETVKAYSDLLPGPHLRLSFSDTGRGISQDVIDRIFEPYFTTKKTGEGTGMGLAVIHGIVKNHGGDIAVHSEPGKGTTFHIILPRLEGGPHTEAQPGDEETPGGTERILLVDDEEDLAEIGIMLLERLGYEVVGKSSAREALQVFREKPYRFDLVISDLTMPQMTGIQLAEQIKQIRPDIPVIVSSGFGDTVPVEQLKAIGVNDLIKKPIIKRDLARMVRTLLDDARRPTGESK